MEKFDGVSALDDGFCFEKVDNFMRSLHDGFNCCYEVVVFVGIFDVFILRRRDLGLLREGCFYLEYFVVGLDVGCFWPLNPLVLLGLGQSPDTDSWLGVEIPRLI